LKACSGFKTSLQPSKTLLAHDRIVSSYCPIYSTKNFCWQALSAMLLYQLFIKVLFFWCPHVQRKTKSRLTLSHSRTLHFLLIHFIRVNKSFSRYTWSSTYDQLPFWLTGHKSIWSYVGHIFINSIF
jgi:hypothetical protein